MADFETLTVGMIVDILTTYSEMENEESDEPTRNAAQRDFDRW